MFLLIVALILTLVLALTLTLVLVLALINSICNRQRHLGIISLGLGIINLVLEIS